VGASPSGRPCPLPSGLPRACPPPDDFTLHPTEPAMLPQNGDGSAIDLLRQGATGRHALPHLADGDPQLQASVRALCAPRPCLLHDPSANEKHAGETPESCAPLAVATPSSRWTLFVLWNVGWTRNSNELIVSEARGARRETRHVPDERRGRPKSLSDCVRVTFGEGDRRVGRASSKSETSQRFAAV
jgi:hypothetical protein